MENESLEFIANTISVLKAKQNARPAVAERRVSRMTQVVGSRLASNHETLPCLSSVYTCCQVRSPCDDSAGSLRYTAARGCAATIAPAQSIQVLLLESWAGFALSK